MTNRFHPAQLDALRNLARQKAPVPARRIAGGTGESTDQVSRHCRALEKRGYALGTPTPGTKRKGLWQITPAGRSILAEYDLSRRSA